MYIQRPRYYARSLRAWLLVSVILVGSVTSSNIPALPPRRPPAGIFAARGGSVQPVSGQKLRKYAESDRMPSLFADSEETYDRYAACLAATEGLRRLRDRDIAEEVQGIRDPQEVALKRKQISAQYVQNSGKVLRALGKIGRAHV